LSKFAVEYVTPSPARRCMTVLSHRRVNVTVMVPNVLRPAVDGRQSVSLGLPPSASLGDVVETLLKLYPKLHAHFSTDRRAGSAQVHFFISEQSTVDISRGKSGLREGQKLYLYASVPRRLADA
jgi:hypothetical protein